MNAYVRFLLALFIVSMLAAGCSSGDESKSGRTTGGGTTTTGTADDGTEDGAGGGDNSSLDTAVTIELSAFAGVTSPTSDKNVNLYAQVWLDSAMSKPATDGTAVTVTFSLKSGSGTIASQNATTKNGLVTFEVPGSALSQTSYFNASASALSASSDTVAFGFIVSTGVAATIVPETVVVSFSNSSLTVSDPQSSNDETAVFVDVYDNQGNPWNGPISLSSSGGSLGQNSLTTSGGSSSTTFSADTELGEVTITVTATSASGTATGTNTISVGPGLPLTIQAVSATPEQIGVKGSGSVESSQVTFRVADLYGNPVSDQTRVRFELQPLLAGAKVSPESGYLTTSNGLVSPVVNAGYRSGALRVHAIIDDPSYPNQISATSDRIIVFGGPGDAQRISLSVEPAGKVISGGYTGLTSVLTATVADKYNNPAKPGTLIYPTCEAGVCGATSEAGLGIDESGRVSFEMFSDFQNLIYQAGGTQGKFSFDFGGTNHNWTDLGLRENGYVQVMIHALGRGSWNDANQNGIYDTGETSIYDPQEPFLDMNFVSVTNPRVRDTSPFEDYLDFNLSGLTGAHFNEGAHDDHAVPEFHEQQYIWADNYIVYSTGPHKMFMPNRFLDNVVDGTFDHQAGEMMLLGVTSSTTQSYGFADTDSTLLQVYFGDSNGNALPAGSTITVVVDSGEDVVETKSKTFEFVGGETKGKQVGFAIKKKTAGKVYGGRIFQLAVQTTVADVGITDEYYIYGIAY